jgi:hypothetical protein
MISGGFVLICAGTVGVGQPNKPGEHSILRVDFSAANTSQLGK